MGDSPSAHTMLRAVDDSPRFLECGWAPHTNSQTSGGRGGWPLGPQSTNKLPARTNRFSQEFEHEIPAPLEEKKGKGDTHSKGQSRPRTMFQIFSRNLFSAPLAPGARSVTGVPTFSATEPQKAQVNWSGDSPKVQERFAGPSTSLIVGNSPFPRTPNLRHKSRVVQVDTPLLHRSSCRHEEK